MPSSFCPSCHEKRVSDIGPNDLALVLQKYLNLHPYLKHFTGKPISVRGIQKRVGHYAKKAGLKISCHCLRHTMATQMLNADTDLVTIQDILGHTRIKTTQRYCKISNLKVERDYFKAMNILMQKMGGDAFMT